MSSTTDQVKAELKQDVNKALETLYRVRDEAKVQVHLASLDAKEAWNKLEPQIADLEVKARDASTHALEAITSTTEKLQSLLASFKKPS